MDMSKICLLLHIALCSAKLTRIHINSIRRSTEMDETTAMKADVLHAIEAGAQIAKENCQQQFQWDRWNCPDEAFYSRSKFGVTREQAFASAILSAGIVYSVWRSCASGQLSCGCTLAEDQPTQSHQETWAWGGCPEGHAAATLIADKFLKSMQGSGIDLPAYANNHNYRLGSTVVGDGGKEECKCHGVSGSCSTKTCWVRSAPFTRSAGILRQKYERALRVDSNSLHRPLTSPQHANHLIFLTDSPNYCKRNNTTGWPGTSGRSCSRTRGSGVAKSERRSCRELCRACGHQVVSKPTTRTWNCNCQFQWCCQVKCSKCTETVIEHHCDANPRQI